MSYSIEIIPQAEAMILAIQDPRIRRLLAKRIDNLANDPDKQGGPLKGSMAGFRSIRAVGQRYRIIYRVDDAETVVIVGAVGIRRTGDKRDIYYLAERLIRLGVIRP